MFRGFTTISYFTDDVPAAAQWYTEVLGVEPYYVRPVDGPPAYVEFRVGDLQAELGLVDHNSTTCQWSATEHKCRVTLLGPGRPEPRSRSRQGSDLWTGP